MSKIGHESGTLAWAIEVKTGKIAYFGSSKAELEEVFPFDPKNWIIGVFVGEGDQEV